MGRDFARDRAQISRPRGTVPKKSDYVLYRRRHLQQARQKDPPIPQGVHARADDQIAGGDVEQAPQQAESRERQQSGQRVVVQPKEQRVEDESEIERQEAAEGW